MWAEFAPAVQLSGTPTVLSTSASALARLGDAGRAKRLLNKALAQAGDRYVCRFNVAARYAQLGDSKRAFESLEQAYLQRSD